MSVNQVFVGENGTINGDIYQESSQSGTRKQKEERSKEGNTERSEEKTTYDLAVSYAGEQEDFVRRVVKILNLEGLKVFFAPHTEEEYKAKDMFEEFYQIYRYKSEYVACFVSNEYLKKDYTMHEYESAYYKKAREREKRLIVVSLDGSLPPHFDKDINYIDAGKYREVQVADAIRSIIV